MEITTILIALVIAFIAWKVLKGVIKFGLIVLVLGVTAWFVSQGGFA